MTGFSNETIKPKAKYKPHIVLIDGWWRVSPWLSKGWPFGYRHERWRAAHAAARNLNEARAAGSGFQL